MAAAYRAVKEGEEIFFAYPSHKQQNFTAVIEAQLAEADSEIATAYNHLLSLDYTAQMAKEQIIYLSAAMLQGQKITCRSKGQVITESLVGSDLS